MLLIHQAKVYQIDVDTLGKLADDHTCKQAYDDVNQAIFEFGELIADECVSELEFQMRVRASRITDKAVRETLADTMTAMWDALMVITNDDPSRYLVDMKPADVTNNVHNEPGVGYDLDNGMAIECADCQVKTDAYLKWVDRAKSLRDVDEITEEAIMDVMKDVPDFGADGPSMGIAIQTEHGIIVIGVKHDDPEFDDDLPTPTHSPTRVLN